MVKQFLIRLNLPQNWPLLVSVTTFIILFLLFSTLSSEATFPYYRYQIGDKVNYSTLLSQYQKHTTDYPALLVIATVFTSFAALIGLLRVPHHKALFSIFFVILTFWWAAKICANSGPRGSSVLKNLQVITFDQSNYKLTLLSNLPMDLDWVERSFLVYMCQIDGDECTLIQSFRDEQYSLSGRPSEAALNIDPSTNTLYLQIGDQKTLITQQP